MAKEDDTANQIISRLDKIAAILQLAFKDQIDRARAEVLADPVSAAILEATADGWIDAGDLKQKVSKDLKQSERTVSRRLAILIGRQALEQSGSGPSTRYRSTGLI